MNCKLAEQNLALWVGGDLDEPSIRELEAHLALCSACRAMGRRLKSSQRMLVKASHVELARPSKPESTAMGAGQVQVLRDREDSIWPNVARGLRALEVRKRKQRFNGWIPAAAVIAACLAIILSPRPAVQTPAPSYDSSGGFGTAAGVQSGYPLNTDLLNGGRMNNHGMSIPVEFDSMPPGRINDGKVNSSVGEFGPGLHNLFDERPVRK